jgi:hypothetical protein
MWIHIEMDMDLADSRPFRFSYNVKCFSNRRPGCIFVRYANIL